MLRIEALRAKQGDCLLLLSGAPDHPSVTLIDGGPGSVWSETLEPRLDQLRAATQPEPLTLDLVVVSHIDDDHIGGVIRLTEQLEDQGANASVEIGTLWHNSFEDLAEAAPAHAEPATATPSGPPTSLWEQQLEALSAAALPESVRQGRTLRDNARTLGLDVNSPFDPLVRSDVDESVIDLPSGLRVTVLGPAERQLAEFRKEWEKQAPRPGTAAAEAYLDDSFSNLASIVMLVEAEGRSMLFTGDARGDDIIANADAAGLLDGFGRRPVDVLKVPHHGSDRNVEVGFFGAFPADHYVISGDGSHGNPEVETFRMLFEARSCDTRPFTIHLTYDPADFRPYRRDRGEPPEPYPVDDLLALFSEMEASGRDFTVAYPAPGASAAAVELTPAGEETYTQDRRDLMAESDNQTDWDQPMSSFGTELDLVSDDVSTGEGAEVESLPEDGFEVVEGYEPPAPPTPQRSEFTPQAIGEVLSLADETTQLRDVGEASFGWPGPIPEIVHGADDRIRITNTKSYPWRAHASLRITAADDSVWIGTGWFVGPNLLVTAGHCVYITNSGVQGRDGWVKRIVVMPGRDGATLPYGSITSTRFWTVVGWAQHRNAEYDYGAIVLDHPLGATTGWLGFGSWSELDGVAGNISGYPGDKPSGTQWYAGRRIDSTTARKVFYDIDTAGGQSGSAVYRFSNGGRYGIAVHAYGGATVNSGTRINARVFANIKAWKEASQT